MGKLKKEKKEMDDTNVRQCARERDSPPTQHTRARTDKVMIYLDCDDANFLLTPARH